MNTVIKNKFKKWGKRTMSIFISLLIVSLIIIILAISNVNSYKKYIYNIEDIPKGKDAIIVLGAGVKKDGTPSDILADRLETSIEVYNEGASSALILSGDHGREEYNEVGAMKDYVVNNIDDSNVFMDHAGFSTYDTMYRAKEIFKVKSAIIITNEYHLPRALYIAIKLGIEAYGVKSDKRGSQFL